MTEFQEKVLAAVPVGYDARSQTSHSIAAKVYEGRPNRGQVSAVSRALYKLRNEGKCAAEVHNIGIHYSEVRWWKSE